MQEASASRSIPTNTARRVQSSSRDLAKHEPFAYTWRLLVVRLHDLGDDYVELRGDEVDRFLVKVTDTGSVLVG
jgi:hypothetical protein